MRRFDIAQNHAGAVTALQFSRDSNQLWSSGKDGCVHCWDLPQAKIEKRWQVSGGAIISMLMADDRIVTVDDKHQIASYNTGGQLLTKSTIDVEPVISAIVDQPSRHIVIGDYRSQLHWFDFTSTDIARGEEQRMLALPISSSSAVATVNRPSPVARQLLKVPSVSKNPTEAASTATSDSDAALTLARKSLQSSREALERTRQSILEMEKSIAELQKLIERLEQR